ncbi:Potassium-transporting ATPase KdpC subunit [Streptomyces cyaneofuscatus]
MTNSTVSSTARLLGAGLRALLVLTLLCGVLYPLAVTGAAQVLFNDRANGSELKDTHGRVVSCSASASGTTSRRRTEKKPPPPT